MCTLANALRNMTLDNNSVPTQRSPPGRFDGSIAFRPAISADSAEPPSHRLCCSAACPHIASPARGRAPAMHDGAGRRGVGIATTVDRKDLAAGEPPRWISRASPGGIHRVPGMMRAPGRPRKAQRCHPDGQRRPLEGRHGQSESRLMAVREASPATAVAGTGRTCGDGGLRSAPALPSPPGRSGQVSGLTASTDMVWRRQVKATGRSA